MHPRRRRSVLITAVAAAALLTAGVTTAIQASAAATGCQVTYRVASQWPGGFTADVTLKNLGDRLTGWTVTWAYSSGQTVTSAWNATVRQSGSAVTATNAAFNGDLGTGSSATFGFNGAFTGANPVPSTFQLNGTTCTGATTTPTAVPTTPTSVPTIPTSVPTTPTANPTTPPANPGTPTGAWPTATGSVSVTRTISVSGTLDGGMKRYCCIGDGGQSESQDPMFNLADGAVLKNVIIGSPAGDGVHCAGRCTIQNVWWEDVGEDAATFKGTGGGTSYVIGGGARSASDKVFQHNGNGTVNISGFYLKTAGKLYRGCGNCTTSYQRHVVVDNVLLDSVGYVVGINSNWGDTARLTRITLRNGSKTHVCAKYKGVPKGSEPTYLGDGWNDSNCIVSPSDVRQS